MDVISLVRRRRTQKGLKMGLKDLAMGKVHRYKSIKEL